MRQRWRHRRKGGRRRQWKSGLGGGPESELEGAAGWGRTGAVEGRVDKCAGCAGSLSGRTAAIAAAEGNDADSPYWRKADRQTNPFDRSAGFSPSPFHRAQPRRWSRSDHMGKRAAERAASSVPHLLRHHLGGSPSAKQPLRRTIRRTELRQIVPLADSTIYEMERRGEFPQRFFLTPRCVVWDLADEPLELLGPSSELVSGVDDTLIHRSRSHFPGILYGRQVVETLVRSTLVVIDPPRFDLYPCFGNRFKPVYVQASVSQ